VPVTVFANEVCPPLERAYVSVFVALGKMDLSGADKSGVHGGMIADVRCQMLDVRKADVGGWSLKLIGNNQAKESNISRFVQNSRSCPFNI
jgi:hypothetical protein